MRYESIYPTICRQCARIWNSILRLRNLFFSRPTLVKLQAKTQTEAHTVIQINRHPITRKRCNYDHCINILNFKVGDDYGFVMGVGESHAHVCWWVHEWLKSDYPVKERSSYQIGADDYWRKTHDIIRDEIEHYYDS